MEVTRLKPVYGGKTSQISSNCTHQVEPGSSCLVFEVLWSQEFEDKERNKEKTERKQANGREGK
jgi:hypothetical protein